MSFLCDLKAYFENAKKNVSLAELSNSSKFQEKKYYYPNLRTAVGFPKKNNASWPFFLTQNDIFISPKITGITFPISRKFELKKTPVFHHILIQKS